MKVICLSCKGRTSDTIASFALLCSAWLPLSTTVRTV